MAMIDKYLKIPVVYKEYVETSDEVSENTEDIYGFGDSEYNEDYSNLGTYKEPRTIMCAMDNEFTLIMGEKGNTSTVSKVMYLTKEKIAVRSMLNEHIILSVTPVYDFQGNISHYESRQA